MSTILISGLPPITDPAPSIEPVDVDVDAPEPTDSTDATAEAEAEAEADTAEATPPAADDADLTPSTPATPSVADLDPRLASAARAAAVDLVTLFKAEIAAFMPELIAQIVAAVKPKRGRPPGSKNRPKVAAEAPRKPGRKPGRKVKGGRKKAR